MNFFQKKRKYFNFFKNVRRGLDLLDDVQLRSPEFHSKRYNRPWNAVANFMQVSVLDKRVPLTQGTERRYSLFGAPYSLIFGVYSSDLRRGPAEATYEANVLADIQQLDESIRLQRTNQNRRWGAALGIRYVPSKLHYDMVPLPLIYFFKELNMRPGSTRYPYADVPNYDQYLGMITLSLYEEAVADCELLRRQMLRAALTANDFSQLIRNADNMRKHHHYLTRWDVSLSGLGPVGGILQEQIYGEPYCLDGLRQIIRGAIGVYFQSARSTMRWHQWSRLFELRADRDYRYIVKFRLLRFLAAVAEEILVFWKAKK
jgi:hypothetical protein